ncbi:hypothetical protein KUL42_21070 [Alteromonas sp. KUL42]|uniref:phytanoyl-CoA dioxygenase family protein n=1 Tax=Alteromonas sp. KUL42 TaxID=2480797 RepID=UPI0010367B27|nr:phytanoyl-CoA dioxygenase family protein [Alteromonas sp. KUL42]TAP35072.1 hypothetical protein EYR97_10390 [Alteromonas sp. KUL42]GEA07346.1 hypothetical protein KUL42_21070 [Alteromonas sp. KUL42]
MNIKKNLGFYYRLVQQYRKNKAVFDRLLKLEHHPLTYYSVLNKALIEERDVIQATMAGDIVIVKDIIGNLQLTALVDELCRDHFDHGYENLENIHATKTLHEMIDCALQVKDALPTLVIQSSIMQRLLAPHSETFFLEQQPNFRLHLPYSTVSQNEDYIESRIGRGKLNPHGQHKDSWRYHPQNTINVWIALTHATEKNGLSLLPKSSEYHAKFNADEREIDPRVKTYPALQYVTNLDPGDALIFHAELLHGSIINTTNKTRAALSMRCTLDKPEFHKKYQYNYIKVDKGYFNNLTKEKLSPQGRFEPKSQSLSCLAFDERGSELQPQSYDESHIYIKTLGETRRFPRKCPHAGADLLNGELDESGKLICPSHRLCFHGEVCN